MSVRKVESRIIGAATKHIAPEHIPGALDAFAEHLKTLPPDELSVAGAAPDAHADSFFGKHAEQNPSKARKRKTPPRTW